VQSGDGEKAIHRSAAGVTIVAGYYGLHARAPLGTQSGWIDPQTGRHKGSKRL